jgi:beta-galactosidase
MDVTLKDGAFAIDGKPTFIATAEIQYFRTRRPLWGRILRLAKEAGCNAVASYFPWSWHEPAEGETDFTGRTHPNRDVARFVKMVRDEGLMLVVKPGPYVYGEVADGGIPDWVRKGHPEIMALGPDDKPPVYPKTPPITYLHPAYLEIVRGWYERFVEGVTSGLDNILLWQVDNETSYDYMMTTDRGMAVDYNPWLFDSGLYAEFLREKLGTLARLSRRYGSRYRRFEDVTPPRKSGPSESDALRLVDWLEFKGWMVAHFHKRLADMLYDLGVPGPFSGNEPLVRSVTYLPAIQRIYRDDRFAMGLTHVDHFGEITHSHIGEFLANIENYGHWTGSPMLGNVEGQASNIAGMWGQPGRNLGVYFRMLAARGMNLHTLYWFNDGENYLKVGAFSDDHQWQSPVTVDARKAPGFETLAHINAFLGAHLEIPTLQPEHDVVMGLWDGYNNFGRLGKLMGIDYRKDYRDLLNVLAWCGLSFRFTDLDTAELSTKRPLVIVTFDFLARDVQRKLVEFVRTGGELLLFGTIPTRDEDLRPCRLLAKALGVKRQEIAPWSTPPRQQWKCIKVRMGKVEMVSLQQSRCFRGDFEPVGVSREGKTVAFRKKLGKGAATVVGYLFRGMTEPERKALSSLLGFRYDGSDVQRFVRRKGRCRLETFLNMGESAAEVLVRGKRLQVPPYSARMAYVDGAGVFLEDDNLRGGSRL